MLIASLRISLFPMETGEIKNIYIFEICTFITFIFMIILNFNIGIFRNGYLEMNRKIIAKKYVKKRLFFDILILIPIIVVIINKSPIYYLEFLVFLKFVDLKFFYGIIKSKLTQN